MEEMTFGETLRIFRKQADLTQMQLAERLGYARHQMVGNWETGRANIPHRDLVLQIAKVLGLDGQDTKKLMNSAGYIYEFEQVLIGVLNISQAHTEERRHFDLMSNTLTPIVIGRDKGCKISIDGYFNAVSRKHIAVTTGEHIVAIKELGSSYGTFITPRGENTRELARNGEANLTTYTEVFLGVDQSDRNRKGCLLIFDVGAGPTG